MLSLPELKSSDSLSANRTAQLVLMQVSGQPFKSAQGPVLPT